MPFRESLAFGPNGNLYVGTQSGKIVVYAPGQLTSSVTLSGSAFPEALVFDSNGNLDVGNGNGSTVNQFAPGSLTPTATFSGLNEPTALAADSLGNLYVANSFGSTVTVFRVPGSNRGHCHPERSRESRRPAF